MLSSSELHSNLSWPRGWRWVLRISKIYPGDLQRLISLLSPCLRTEYPTLTRFPSLTSSCIEGLPSLDFLKLSWNSTFTSTIGSGCAEMPEDGHYFREAGQYLPKTNIVNLFSFGWRSWPVYIQLRSKHPESSRHLQFQGRLALLEGISRELALNFLVPPQHPLLWLFLGLAEKRFSLLRSHDWLKFVSKRDTSHYGMW